MNKLESTKSQASYEVDIPGAEQVILAEQRTLQSIGFLHVFR